MPPESLSSENTSGLSASLLWSAHSTIAVLAWRQQSKIEDSSVYVQLVRRASIRIGFSASYHRTHHTSPISTSKRRDSSKPLPPTWILSCIQCHRSHFGNRELHEIVLGTSVAYRTRGHLRHLPKIALKDLVNNGLLFVLRVFDPLSHRLGLLASGLKERCRPILQPLQTLWLAHACPGVG